MDDLLGTALDKAESEGRTTLGPFELVELGVFGLRTRAAPWWQSAPLPARRTTGWAGVLSGLVLSVAATLRPWAVPADPANPVGTVPWPGLLLALWCAVTLGVVAGRAGLVRAAAAAVLVALPAGLLADDTPWALATGSTTMPIGQAPSDTAFTLALPVWLCAALALGAAPVTRTAVPYRITLPAAAAVLGDVVAHHRTTPTGVTWLGAPY